MSDVDADLELFQLDPQSEVHGEQFFIDSDE